ncbi:MAG: methylated-DNA--[protein]-cysteine S-methyltransferase [Bacteriovoracaceae bacterium]|nr:methylated-DNA--[protein]-cysteine S-methyltransferase [Bacteriovoracaceae bacterium]
MFRQYIKSPIGTVEVLCDDTSLLSVSFVSKATKKENSNKITKKTIRQLEEYFSGKRKDFDLPLKIEGTQFQKKVWKNLTRIPFGKLKTYGQVAKSIGKPLACRAVGGANNKNKHAIVIPCHRVIGASGDLVGYGGGLKYKKYLLELEGSI